MVLWATNLSNELQLPGSLQRKKLKELLNYVGYREQPNKYIELRVRQQLLLTCGGLATKANTGPMALPTYL